MIFVDRGATPAPKILEERGTKELEKAREVFESADASDTYARFRFKTYRHPSVKDALAELFHGKCAYCESSLDPKMGADIEHFRPKQRCVDEQGNLFPLHYWWLALAWENLYLACRACNSAKKNRFPIGAERAPTELRETDVEALFAVERPMLLDPCRRDDDPEEHFVYADDAQITSDTERGRITIETCALNRRSLVEARRERMALISQLMDATRAAIEGSGSDAVPAEVVTRLVEQVKSLTQPDMPFAGMCRQVSRRFLEEMGIWSEDLDEDLVKTVGATRSVSQAEQRQVVDDFTAFKTARSAYSLDDDDAGDYYLKSHTIQRIVIRNFRPIQDLTLEVGGEEEVPWLMLLGENGCGKSSVIKAVALTLMGEKYRMDPDLALSAGEYLRRGEDSGYVEVYLSGMEEPMVLEFNKDDANFKGGEAPKVLLLAYGATRLLPRRNIPHRRMRYAMVDNLFDPFTPLRDASAWLLGLPREQFDGLKPALNKLLNLGRDGDLHQNQEEGIVEVTLHGDQVPLEQLSDGYQCVVALAAEVMAILMERWKDMAAAEGIVLLDEVGSHLHPSWKMKIVSSLRETFPSVQFVVSTHDPLCLRGMKEGEVWVMGRDPDNRVMAHNELPNPEAMRVDQILQSDFFNLPSTVDDGINALYERYYELLSMRDRDSILDEELDQVRQRLAEVGELGENDRERMMLEVIDEYRVDRSREQSREGRVRLEQQTRNRLREIWSDAVEKSLQAGVDGESST